jgi:ABC-type transport system involved in multi-copper enzyme maturation permease subunit
VIPQLRAETLKVRSTRTTLGLVLGMAALILLFVILTALLTSVHEMGTRDQQRSLYSIGSFAGLFAALAGIMLVTGEYRFGTIRPTYLFTPKRSTVLVAKVAASLVAGFTFALIGEILSVAVGGTILHERSISISLTHHDYWLLTIGTLIGTALWGAIGVGLGMIVRNQVGAIIGILAWGFVIQNLLFGLAPSVGRWTPDSAQNGMMGMTDAHLLDPAPGAIVLIGWTIAICIAGAVMAAGRDVN